MPTSRFETHSFELVLLQGVNVQHALMSAAIQRLEHMTSGFDNSLAGLATARLNFSNS